MLQTVDYIKLGLAIFCAFVGACVQFVNDKNQDGATMFQRLVSLFAAIVLMALLEALAILEWNWNTIIVCILGFVLSIGAQKFIRLLAQYYEESNGLLDFIRRLRVGYDAFNNKQQPPKSE